MFGNWFSYISPSAGSRVCPASADAVKRTAPPPMIPKPLTAKKNKKIANWNLLNLTTNVYLQDSQFCKWRKQELCGHQNSQ